MGVNFMEDFSRENTKKDYLKEALLLKKWLSLCSSRAKERERFEAAFFEAVRTVLVKVSSTGKLSLPEINKQITELLNQSIKSTGVINVINVSEEVSLFDPEFLDRVRALESSNLTRSILEKLLDDEVKVYTKTNLVKAEEFSELLKNTRNKYINGHITNDEVIEELIKIAKLLREAHLEGEKLGLTKEELAFYNAIALPENIHDFYDDETLIKITQKLTDSLRENRTIDWQKKESARAKMRRTVKRLLKKYDYPPKEIDGALDKVIAQCELWVDEVA